MESVTFTSRRMKDHISVCVCTFRRNKMLERLLKELALQETDDLFDFSVVVVDNDMAGPARETVMRLKAELGLDISYDIEPERSIPAARNHTLRLARGNYIAIIDDDEFPTGCWLVTMYRSILKYEVDGVLGPTYSIFEGEPPIWLMKSGICARPVYCTGTIMRWDQTTTRNVLIKKEVFDKRNLCFDKTFKDGVGEDPDFFRKAILTGFRFIAVKEAPVYEIVPPERWTKRYYLKRSLVCGFNAHKITKGQMRGLSRIAVPIKSACAVAVYALAFPFCACLGDHVMMNCLIRGGHHLSRLFAMLGIKLINRQNF